MITSSSNETDKLVREVLSESFTLSCKAPGWNVIRNMSQTKLLTLSRKLRTEQSIYPTTYMLLEENGMDEKRNNCDTKEIETKESAGEKYTYGYGLSFMYDTWVEIDR